MGTQPGQTIRGPRLYFQTPRSRNGIFVDDQDRNGLLKRQGLARHVITFTSPNVEPGKVCKIQG